MIPGGQPRRAQPMPGPAETHASAHPWKPRNTGRCCTVRRPSDGQTMRSGPGQGSPGDAGISRDRPNLAQPSTTGRPRSATTSRVGTIACDGLSAHAGTTAMQWLRNPSLPRPSGSAARRAPGRQRRHRRRVRRSGQRNGAEQRADCTSGTLTQPQHRDLCKRPVHRHVNHQHPRCWCRPALCDHPGSQAHRQGVLWKGCPQVTGPACGLWACLVRLNEVAA
jgi:hypothetical protein